MTRDQQKHAMDKILSETFRNGGPQRPIDAGYRIKWSEPNDPTHFNPKHKPDPVLLAEQQRLIKTWRSK